MDVTTHRKGPSGTGTPDGYRTIQYHGTDQIRGDVPLASAHTSADPKVSTAAGSGATALTLANHAQTPPH